MITYIDLRTGAEMFGCRSSVLCLGTFDGVHRGHFELIRQTLMMRDRLKEDDLQILGGAWCFRQPPAVFLSNNRCKQLTTLDEKLDIFKKSGLDFLAVGDFEDLRNIEAQVFVEDFLKNGCGCKGVVCGFNFTFGKNGIGNPDLLRKEFKNNVTVLDPVTHNGIVISSSEIRRLISIGDVEAATELIGRPYTVSAKVVEGKRLGRKMGFPTVNQYLPKEKLLPLSGVYATKTLIDGKEYNSVTNVGSNPTVENTDIRCETHIIDYSGDLYGKCPKIAFYKFLRPEQKFKDVEELMSAIRYNIEETQKYFSI